MGFISTIIEKHPRASLFFKTGKLKDHHFSKEILQNINESQTKISHYLQVMAEKFKDHSIVRHDRSGRYHLWFAQEEARIIAANTSLTHSSNLKRSLYCLFVLAGFERFLGEQHYLTLDSHEFI